MAMIAAMMKMLQQTVAAMRGATHFLQLVSSQGRSRGRGRGGSSPPPQNFWELKNITINVPKAISLKQVNMQQLVLNVDSKTVFYNFATFNRV